MLIRWVCSKPCRLHPLIAAVLAAGLILAGCTVSQENSVVERRIDRISERLGINLRYIDPGIRPEDDLYRHVNGNWLVNASLPPDLSSYGTFTEVAAIADYRIARIVKEISEAKAQPPGSNNRKIANLYRSTLALVSGQAPASLEFLAAELEAIEDIENPRDIWRVVGSLQATGAEAFFAPRVKPDLHDSSRYQLGMEPADLGLPSVEDYRDEASNEARAAYCRFVIAVLAAIAQDKKDPPDCSQALAFEADLAAAKSAPADMRRIEFIDNRVTRAELGQRWPNIDWSGYFAALGTAEPESVNISDVALVDWLNAVSKTGCLGAWRDYLAVRLVASFAGQLSGPIYESWFAFERGAVRGVDKDLPARVRALSFVNEIFGSAIGKIYLARHFSARTRGRASALAEAIRRAMATEIRASDWLSDEGKQRALAKLDRLNFQYGGPGYIPDFSPLEIDADDPYGNLKRARAFEVRLLLRDIGRPVDRSRWPIKPQTANAYYEPPTNQIFLPAAILLPPFFLGGGDNALNYGALGAIIGHEVMHAFDDQGRKYNAAGTLESWWTPGDVAAYEARVTRLLGQLEAASHRFVRPVDADLVVGEALSDLAGLAAAYRAYLRSTGFRTRSREIAGYTGYQRFFLAWAQIWRRMHRDEEAARLLLLDEHPPAELRANLTASNISAFYSAFGVRSDDGMFRQKQERLSIW